MERWYYRKDSRDDTHVALGSRSKRNKVIVSKQYFDRKMPLMNDRDTPSTNPNFELYRYQAPSDRRMDKSKSVDASATPTGEEETTETEKKGIMKELERIIKRKRES